VHIVLFPDLGEFVAGRKQFVDQASGGGVVTPLPCQGSEIRDETGSGGMCVSVGAHDVRHGGSVNHRHIMLSAWSA